MRIAIDLDGTLFKTYHIYEKRFGQTFGKKPPAMAIASFSILTKEEKEWSLDYFQHPEIYQKAKLDKQAVKVIRELFREGHYIFFVSCRPIQFSALTYEIMKGLNFPFLDIRFVPVGQKLGIWQTKRIELVIDDEFSCAKQAIRNKIHAILLAQKWNENLRSANSYFHRAKDWSEVKPIIEIIEKEGGENESQKTDFKKR